jgi:TonB family protein
MKNRAILVLAAFLFGSATGRPADAPVKPEWGKEALDSGERLLSNGFSIHVKVTFQEWVGPSERINSVFQPLPVYPSDLLYLGITGTAVVGFTITEAGLVENPVFLSAGGANSEGPEFGKAALDAVRTWRFVPPKVRGKPGRFPAKATFIFSLYDESGFK